MLRVRTAIGPSAVAGIGLFAAEPIAEGQVIWAFDPGLDLVVDAAAPGPALLAGFLETYGFYVAAEGKWYVALDNTRFINHSAAPNAFDDGPFAVRARRAIAAGEEITCDYRETCDKFRSDPPVWA